MPRFFSAAWRWMARVALRSRALRWVALVFLLLWALDRGIETATDAAWFASLGYGRLFWHQVEVRALLFWGFALPALGLAIVTMRVLARPTATDATAPPLPPALRGWDEWRPRVLKAGWLVLLVTLWLSGRELAGFWVEALQCWHGAAWDAAPWGLRAGWWVFQLPFLRALLDVCWAYGLVLLAVAALGGGVRALPFLASRQMSVPRRWESLLLVQGATMLLLRALGYALAAPQLLVGVPVRAGDVFVGGLQSVLGVGLCFWAALGLRRSVKRWLLVPRVAAALMGPLVLGVLLWPVRSLVNTTFSARIGRAQESATRAAWNIPVPTPLGSPLESPALPATKQPPRFERDWPLWDDATLLRASRANSIDEKGRIPARNEAGHIVEWRLVGQTRVGEKTVGLLAGLSVSSQRWGADRNAEILSEYHEEHKKHLDTNAVSYRAVDLQAAPQGVPLDLPAHATQPHAPHFYGLDAPTLFGAGENIPHHGVAGVHFDSPLAKLAWAWRLRDPLVLVDAFVPDRAHRILVFRDVREAARRLAPMFAWDAPRPGLGVWTLEGYGVSREFPSALAPASGPFVGFNAARPAVRLALDPATGAICLSAAQSNPFVATWKRALPELWAPAAATTDASPAPARFFAYEEACAALEAPFGGAEVTAGLGEQFWSVQNGAVVLVRRAVVPSAAVNQLKILDASAHADHNGTERLESGVPALWPDARAPGGFWVARPYFSVSNSNSNGLGERVRFERVWLSAAQSDAPVVSGANAVEALREFERQSRSVSLSTPDGTTGTAPSGEGTEALEDQLERVIQQLETAMQSSRWAEAGRLLAREKQISQALKERRHAATRPTPAPLRPTPTPSANP